MTSVNPNNINGVVDSGVTPNTIWGVNSQLSNSIVFLDNRQLLYIGGNHLVIHNVNKNTQKFLPLAKPQSGTAAFDVLQDETETGEESKNDIGKQTFSLDAFCISEDKKYVALSYSSRSTKSNGKAGEAPRVVIYDITVQRIRVSFEVTFKEVKKIISLSFSGDNRYLAGLSNRPNPVLFTWHWEKSKIVSALLVSTFLSPTLHKDEGGGGMSNIQVNEVSFNVNTKNPYLICITGDRVFRILKFHPDLAVPLRAPSVEAPQYKNYTHHIWFRDKIILGTEDGKIFFCEPNETKQEIGFDFSFRDNDPNTEFRVRSIAGHKFGFLASSGTYVTAFEVPPDNQAARIKQLRSWNTATEISFPIEVNNYPSIHTLVVSPNEDAILCGVGANQIQIARSFGEHISTTFDMGDTALVFKPLSHAFHQAPVIDMDTCVRKPILASASIDGCLKIWNYQDDQLLLTKDFKETCLSISLHPSGFYILAAFQTNMYMLQILHDGFHTLNHYRMDDCRLVKFSRGGQFFAVHAGNKILIRHTWTHDILREISLEKPITSMVWNEDDFSITVTDIANSVYDHMIHPQKPDSSRDQPRAMKFLYTSGLQVPVSGFICRDDLPVTEKRTDGRSKRHNKAYYISHPNKTIARIHPEKSLKQIGKFPVHVDHLFYNDRRRMLMGTTAEGAVVRFKTLIEDEGSDNKMLFTALPAQASKIKSMCLSFDGNWLFTGANDGCILAHRIKETDNTLPVLPNMADDVLLPRKIVVTQNKEYNQLVNIEADMQARTEAQMLAKDSELDKELEHALEDFNSTMDQLNQEQEKLKIEREKMNREFSASINQLKDDHKTTFLNRQQESKDSVERERIQHVNLDKTLSKSIEAWRAKAQEIERMQRESQEAITTDFTKRLSTKLRELERLKQVMQNKQNEQNEFEANLEEDTDREVMEIMTKYEILLREERKAREVIRAENTSLKQEFDSMRKTLESYKNETQIQIDKIKSLQSLIKIRQKEFGSFKLEVETRIESSVEKEKRLAEAKHNNQEFTKVKFLLEQKMAEEVETIAPRQKVLGDLKQQHNEMKAENGLLQVHRKSQVEELTQVKANLASITTELDRQRQQRVGFTFAMKQINDEISSIVSDLNENEEKYSERVALERMKQSIVILFKKYCAQPSDALPPPKGYVYKYNTSTEDTHVSQIMQLPYVMKPKTIEDTRNAVKKIINKNAATEDLVQECSKNRKFLENENNHYIEKMKFLERSTRTDRRELMKQNVELINETKFLTRQIGYCDDQAAKKLEESAQKN